MAHEEDSYVKVANHAYLTFSSSEDDEYDEVYAMEKGTTSQKNEGAWESLQFRVQFQLGLRVRLYHNGARHPVDTEREEWQAKHRPPPPPPGTHISYMIIGPPEPNWQAMIPQIPAIVHDVLQAITSSGAAVGIYKAIDLWIKHRNGRKARIKMDNVEIEITQMKPEDVVRMFELFLEKADRSKIRELLSEYKPLDSKVGEASKNSLKSSRS